MKGALMRHLAVGPFVALALLIVSPSAARAASPGDPIEPVNRAVFWFNDQVDVYVLEPAAKGWDWLLPDVVQKSIGNFFDNIRFPINAVNDLLQGKPVECGTDVGRFAINTTVGVLGFMDPASRWGLEKNYEDFGQTLGVWHVPPGPYLVLPLIGPSNPRDTAGMTVDSFLAVYPWFIPYYYSAGAKAVETVNFRSQILDEVQEAKRSAFDYYVFVRDAYNQQRRRQIEDRMELSEEEQENLYYPEEE